LAREAVRKSLVLLKNGNSPNQQFLPLPKKARRILVAGTHANNLGYQCGGWSIQWMGDSGNITTGMCIFFLSWWIHAIFDSIYIWDTLNCTNLPACL
jgi:beta-glucosidase-like glycosyl hydrolase